MKLQASSGVRFWVKIAAFVLAVITYIYIRGEIGERKLGIVEREFLKKVSSKVIPVRVNLKGEPPSGYQILKANIIIKPEKVILVGKEEDLRNISEVLTSPVDVRKFTHTQLLYVPLEPVSNAINISAKMVEVEIPIIAQK
jgi:YbbR domain-containing protein